MQLSIYVIFFLSLIILCIGSCDATRSRPKELRTRKTSWRPSGDKNSQGNIFAKYKPRVRGRKRPSTRRTTEAAPTTLPTTSPTTTNGNGLPDCVAADFVRCQLAGIEASIEARKNSPIPIFTRCEMLRGLLMCDSETLETCNETPDLVISDNIAEIEGRVEMFREQCRCIDSGDEFENCRDQCSADPCQNHGTCISESYKFIECQCPDGFSGQFCEICEKCNKCSRFLECDCPDGKGGPLCGLECSDLQNDLDPLFLACIQVANDVYFLSPYPSFCLYALVLDECIAATANTCGMDPRATLAALDLEAGFDQAKFNLNVGICLIGGVVPFEI